ncbi:MAG: hypothetical protein QM310_10445, partial [Pseudomonadota bacterium]|nr:hypothetical protein [Pseudomonadota bacterium]
THPNGGGLRALLGQNNYVVHEAAYGSKIGAETDVCHWNRKFRSHMSRILATRHQDVLFSDGAFNRVVMFQSGPSSSWIDAEGREPGDPDSREKTIANYKAAYRSMLQYFMRERETLFVAVTAPPLVKPEPVQGLMGRILRRPDQAVVDEAGKRIRSFNNWLKNFSAGWLSDYPLKNVVVFDYFHILTAYGVSNWLRYPSGEGGDGHPNSRGNTEAARTFIPFINRALNRMTEQASPLSVGRHGAFASKVSAR